MTGDAHDELVGRVVLGRYRMVHRLATGGMGVIYLARSEGAKGFVKPVVIKRILPHLVGDEVLVGMFAREARIMSNLSHPGIVSVVDFAEEDGAYLMVLEYVHGFHLGRWSRYVRQKRGAFPVEAAVHIVVCVLDALHYAHTLAGPGGEPMRIVHRDISPSNVLIDTEGRVKLTDFGIARMRNDKTAASDKRALKGTFSYMAPELLQMADPSPKSDLYSCAVVLHEVITGKNEFYSKDIASTAWRAIEHVPTPIEEVRPDAPPGLGAVLRKALAKAPEDRQKSALELAQELRQVLGVADVAAARMLAEAVAADFNDPDMAITAQVTDLASLEQKWREEGKRFSFRPRKTAPLSMSPSTEKLAAELTATVRHEIQVDSEPEVGWFARRKGLVVGAGAAIVAASAATILAVRKPTLELGSPNVILVEGSVAAVGWTPQPLPPAAPAPAGGSDGAGVSPEGVPTAGAAQANPAADDPGRKTAETSTVSSRTPAPKSRSELLTRSFARQQPRIARCFSEHASDVSGNPEVSVRFEVGTDGHVVSVEVQPAPLASTPLGQCIAGVAKTTQFGNQPEPTSFRIPITAKRGP